ncbi:MAG TPA: ROK family protein [Anaerolineae bacterium]|nr:ROK family protein [Anaerolineae bacterium]
MSSLIAVDLGGTNLRVALFTRDQPPAAELIKIPTLASEGPDVVIARMIEAIHSILPKKKRGLRIGVGSPGPLDPFDGVILDTPNMPGWKNIPLCARLSEHFSCPVMLENDANLAALGEWRHGAAQGTQNLIYLTISTGIGGGVIVDGKLLRGARGLAGELGHMTVERNGPECGCGQRGHLEAIAAGPAIARKVLERIETGESSILTEMVHDEEPLTAAYVGRAARMKDRLAMEVVSEAGRHIGRHLASLVHAFNPEMIVLGGGVSRIGHPFFNAIEQALHEHVIHPMYVEDLPLVPAKLGDEAGLIGAMVMVSQA